MSALTAGSGVPNRYRVQSVDRAVDLLEALGGSAVPLGVTDLTHALGMSKSATFALVQTLVDRGLIDSTGDGLSRRYTLGIGMARLGALAVQKISLVDVAMPYLRDLTAMSRHSSRVATLSDGAAVVVGQVDGPSSVRLELPMFRAEQLHCSAVGKAILAAMTDEEALRIVRQTGMPRRTEYTITDEAVLLRDLARTRIRGFSVDDEEDSEGVFCMGAALRNHTGACCGAISVTGLKVTLQNARAEEVGRAVVEAARAISARLGVGA